MVRGEEYAPVATPSYSPGPDNSPIMTWGEVAATPLRIEDDDDSTVANAPVSRQPGFHIQPRKSRDKAAIRYVDPHLNKTYQSLEHLCMLQQLQRHGYLN